MFIYVQGLKENSKPFYVSDIGKNLDVWTTQQKEEANKIEKYIRDGTCMWGLEILQGSIYCYTLSVYCIFLAGSLFIVCLK